MKLYLLRHGESEGVAATDAERRLTEAGEREARSVARQFAEQGLTLDRCLCSPFTRAEQTAKAFLSELPGAPVIEYDRMLIPERRAAELIAGLQGLEAEHVLLVSHNPLLSELNAVLVEGDISQMNILGTCDLVAIELDFIGIGQGRRSLTLSPALLSSPC